MRPVFRYILTKTYSSRKVQTQSISLAMAHPQSHVSLSLWAKRLETVSGADFQTLLENIKSPVYIDESILKNELGLLNTKILKLIRSNNDYDAWKGCHTAVIICAFNPLVLTTYGGQLLATIYSKLEQKTSYIESKVWTKQFDTMLITLVSSMATMMDLMRDKPTLSREGLVPKLKAIIPTLIQLTLWKPSLTLPVLQKLLCKHSTTFKPYANKFHSVISTLFIERYNHLDSQTKRLVCNNFASLHLIKLQNYGKNQNKQDESTDSHHKSFNDETWRTGLLYILKQFKPILELCGELLDFEQDAELRRLINSLPSVKENDPVLSYDFLKPLKLDMNEPFTLWDIPNRINLLVDILTAFITLPTPYPIRVPIGAIHSVAEALMGINTRYLPLKRELRRDQDLTASINIILPKIQFNSIRLWLVLVKTYGKHCLLMTPQILSSLELFVPLKPKSTQIDFENCYKLKSQFQQIFKLSNYLLLNLGHQFNEVDPIVKLIDVALFLSEDKSLVESFFQQQSNKNIQNIQNNNNSSKKKNQKKDQKQLGSMSDLYTNSENFVIKNNLSWYDEINTFLYHIISNWKLPSGEQVRVTKYIVSISNRLQSKLGFIPQSFIKLLRIIVINPGYERVSILPIAVSLLKQSSDEVFDVLCHPRLPMGIVHNVKNFNIIDINEDTSSSSGNGLIDEVELQSGTGSENGSTSLLDDVSEEKSINIPILETKTENVIDESKIFKKRAAEETETNKEDNNKKRVKINESVEQIEFNKDVPVDTISQMEATTEKKNDDDEEDDDDEDFVIPDIDLSDDDEDDE